MAIIKRFDDKISFHLNTYHLFGRLKGSVNSLVAKPEISKIHAALEWNGNNWQLIDLSSNGTWLNHQKIPKNVAHIVKVGDVINFANKLPDQFIVEDIAPPTDMLVTFPDPELANEITLDAYHLLPNENEPELSLFFNDELSCWCVEDLVEKPKEFRKLSSDDVIKFANKQWQLKLNNQIEQTIRLTPEINSLKELAFLFKVSADEEATQLILNTDDESVDLKVRSHHYLTLNLARKRMEDINNGLPSEKQGWVYSEQLSESLGMDLSHFNIQVHRARKQFSDNFSSHGLDHLFERQSGRIRLGSERITINKAGTLE